MPVAAPLRSDLHTVSVSMHIYRVPIPCPLTDRRTLLMFSGPWRLAPVCVFVCVCVCVCVVRYLHQDGWKHTVWQNHMNPRGTLPERKDEITVGTHKRWTTTLKMEDTGDRRC